MMTAISNSAPLFTHEEIPQIARKRKRSLNTSAPPPFKKARLGDLKTDLSWEKLSEKSSPLGERISVTRLIGKGVTSSVYEGRDLNGKVCAVKVFGKGDLLLKSFNRELKMLNCVKRVKQAIGLQESFLVNSSYIPESGKQEITSSDETQGVLILDYHGSDLREFLKTTQEIPFKTTCLIASRLIDSLEELQKLQIIHGDLKMRNIVFNPATDILKLIDWNLARHIDSERYHSSVIQTPLYRAPEVILEHYGLAVDMWSVGVIILELLTGKQLVYPQSSDDISIHNEILHDLVDRIGFPPNSFIEASPNVSTYFVKTEGKYAFKTPLTTRPKLESLATLLEKAEKNLSELVAKMLVYESRITPSAAKEFLVSKNLYVKEEGSSSSNSK